jgi:hypothetical protein
VCLYAFVFLCVFRGWNKRHSRAAVPLTFSIETQSTAVLQVRQHEACPSQTGSCTCEPDPKNGVRFAAEACRIVVLAGKRKGLAGLGYRGLEGLLGALIELGSVWGGGQRRWWLHMERGGCEAHEVKTFARILRV